MMNNIFLNKDIPNGEKNKFILLYHVENLLYGGTRKEISPFFEIFDSFDEMDKFIKSVIIPNKSHVKIFGTYEALTQFYYFSDGKKQRVWRRKEIIKK